MRITTETGICVVLSGPAGVGKDEVRRLVTERNPDCSPLITCTNREIRPNEIDGRDYFFKTTQQFIAGIEAGEYLEYAEYRPGEYKGTAKGSLKEVLTGKKIIWRIDPEAAANAKAIVRERIPDVGEEIAKRMVSVYLHPGDWSLLEGRYFGRDPNADRATFIATFEKDKSVWEKNKDRYDLVVINAEGKLDDTVRSVEMVMRGNGKLKVF